MNAIAFDVVALQRQGQVARIELLPREGAGIPHAPGQYLNIVLPDGSVRPYSIANAPQEDGRLELHVRHAPGGAFSGVLFGTLKVGDQLMVNGPYGRLVADSSSLRPALLAAGGTGFAPVRAIAQSLLRLRPDADITLYWGVRRVEDLYDLDTVAGWASAHPRFRFVPVVSEEDAGDMRRGLLHEALLADHPDLSAHDLYAAGPQAMVELLADQALAAGLPAERLFGDHHTTAARAQDRGPSLQQACAVA